MPEPRFFLESDSYTWLSHTRDLMKSGEWRLRWTFMDNAPYGREMHWSHLIIWTVRGIANMIMAQTGWPAARAVELAGVWVMPLFQFLFLALALVAISRKWGLLPAAGFMFAFLTYESVAIAFHPLKPDHHAMQLYFVLASFACLQMGGLGWVGSSPASESNTPFWIGFPGAPARRTARNWFIASGVFGGLALWIGSTVWLISLAIIALACLPALPRFHSPEPDAAYEPILWRWWAAVGCFVGLIFYLLEYAPNHFSMRLEVNHPLAWLSWIGVAWGLETLARVQQHDRLDRQLFIQLLLPTLLAMALPLAVWLGPESWFLMNDPMLKRLHARYITEFQPFIPFPDGNWWALLATFRSYFLALPGIAIWLVLAKDAPSHKRHMLLSAVLYSTLLLIATLLQKRWGFSFAGSLVWLTLVGLCAWLSTTNAARRTWQHWGIRIWIILILADGCYANYSRLHVENNAAACRALSEDWIAYNLQKRNALRWGFAAGTNQWRFAGIAVDTPLLYYYAGIPSVASYYWENTAGWQAEATLLSDTTPGATQALEVAQARGLTHIVSSIRSSYPEIYFYIATGIHDPWYAALHTLDGWLTYEPFANRPAWTVPAEQLSEIGRSDYIFKTPSGYAKEKLRYQVFAIQSHNETPTEMPP
jgi:hypothetical protein